MAEKKVLIKQEVLLENPMETNAHLTEDQTTLNLQQEAILTTLLWIDADNKISQQL